MMFRFICPICNAATDVEEQYAGQAGGCFSCGGMITLPTLEAIAAEKARATEGSEVVEAIVVDKTQQLFERDAKRNSRACLKSLAILATVFISGGIIWWLVATFGPSIGLLGDEGAGRSRRNLQRIALAMNEYHTDHGSFPPAYFADANGKPMHSWRVILLPYLGKQDLYDQYDFSEPWDGPTNSQLTWQMPGVYQGHDQQNTATTMETNYMVVSGYETAFPGASSINKSSITDNPTYTILVAEIENNGVDWMEPVDLDAAKMSFVVNANAGTEIGSIRNSGALIATVDGKTHHLQDDASPEVIESMATIAGGEPLQAQDLSR